MLVELGIDELKNITANPDQMDTLIAEAAELIRNKK
jgi:hypothetical protein